MKRLSEAIQQIFNLQYSIPACPGWDYQDFFSSVQQYLVHPACRGDAF
jgi:hypothetical protein